MFPLILVAAAAVRPSPLPDAELDLVKTACSSASINQATLEHLGSIPTDPWMVTLRPNEPGTGLPPAQQKAVGYTRIRIDFRPCGGTDPWHYGDQARWWRGLIGKHLQKTFQLSIKLSPININVSPNLLNIKRDSDKKGESWMTSNDNGDIPTPYFRVDRDLKVLLTPEVISSRDYSSEIASGVIDLVSRASAAITPQVPLITSENKQRFNDAASFVDSTINGLLHVAIDEKASLETPVDPGTTGQVLAIYAVQLPLANDVYSNSARPDRQIGVWAVIAEPIRESMFGDVENGHLVTADISPAVVLGYQVDANKTVRETLAGAQNVISARDELVKAAKDLGDKGYKLCRIIDDEAEAIGLTPVDGAAVAWAYVQDLGLTGTNESHANQGCSRIGHYPA